MAARPQNPGQLSNRVAQRADVRESKRAHQDVDALVVYRQAVEVAAHECGSRCIRSSTHEHLGGRVQGDDAMAEVAKKTRVTSRTRCNIERNACP